MERNVILAIVLSILVIIGFHFFMSTTGEKAGAPDTRTSRTTKSDKTPKTSAKTSTKNESKRPETLVPAQKSTYQAKIKEALVDTSLYRAKITEAGGRFTSFTLKKYRQTIDPDSPPVELINAPKLGLPLEIYPTKAPGLAIAPYKAEPEELKLSSGQKGDLKLLPLILEPLTLEKVFTFQDESYLFTLRVKVKNPNKSPLTDQLLFRMVSNPVSKLDRRYVFRGPAYSTRGDYEEVKLKKPGSLIEYTGELDWVGYGDPYFLMAIVPPADEAWRVTFRRLNKTADEVILWSPTFTLPPQGEDEIELKLYFGPKSLQVLKKVGYNLANAVNFGFFDPIAKPLLYALQFFYRYTGNYGVAIILLTAVIRILFWPLNHLSYKSMRKMQELQPIIMKLKEKYGDDKARLNQELMQLYKTYKINPFMGCLPMVIQIPVFFALYKVLLMAIELRHAPFFGWIKDLSAPDRLYIGFDIPYLGGIPVLTILMGISMYFQQKLSPTSMDPTQEKMMLMMPIIFTILFINFPSGLVLYWLTNNLLSIFQQLLTNKMLARSR
ncbi:MAG: membrane protein insertase YidC [Thermodesulfobacteria bacterium]|nr:membrane protein insertase YidC [Thermodesulfobacteriota bacterium]